MKEYTNLEWLECVLSTLEHLANSGLLLSLGQVVHRLIDLDGCRKSRSLDRAHQMATKTYAGLEEVGMALNLLGPLGQGILTFHHLKSL